MDVSFFQNNRKMLSEALDGGIIVIGGYSRLQRSNDSAHPFMQESNFWYLCGIDEPDWKLVIDGGRRHSWLIAPSVSDVHRIFDGGIDDQTALQISGVDEVVQSDDFPELMRRLARTHKLAYTVGQSPYADHYNFELNPAIDRTRQSLERQFEQVQDCQKEIAVLRARKQSSEISQIEKAVAISIAAFESIKSTFGEYRYEYEIEADFAREIRFAGAQGVAYESIVAAGINACTLHYSKNADRLRSKRLVLMDMGAQYGGYAADITRTYAKGEPTKRQRAVHAAVESAHHRIIGLIGPMVSVEDYQREVDVIMREAIGSLGLGDDDESLRKYFPHAISHGLGIDVHDSLGGPKYFEENMVLTVEPGIYIPEESIGVRIEDDILVTSGGRRNLSAKLSTAL